MSRYFDEDKFSSRIYDNSGKINLGLQEESCPGLGCGVDCQLEASIRFEELS
jgi:hypothetical protein